MKDKSNWKFRAAMLLAALAVGACAGPQVIKLAGEGIPAGEVTFMHEKHTMPVEDGGAGIECSACHHEHRSIKMQRKCRNCHVREPEEGGPVSMEQVAHALCRDCHLQHEERGGEAKVPKACGDCHIVEGELK